jgi:hypothetical protein
MGHVLGLADEYYTLWDEEKCQYSDEYNMSNIMSATDTGTIPTKDIESLKEVYFK